jgi:hypothetical protein
MDEDLTMGTPDQGHPAPGWTMGYPHPYFGRKILVFLRLQTGLRCKIVKTKEFPAKSSRIRSYGTFWPLLAASGWKAARKGRAGTMFEGRLLRIIVHKDEK